MVTPCCLLRGISLSDTLLLAEASLRGTSLSGTLLLAEASLRGVSLSGTLLPAGALLLAARRLAERHLAAGRRLSHYLEVWGIEWLVVVT